MTKLDKDINLAMDCLEEIRINKLDTLLSVGEKKCFERAYYHLRVVYASRKEAEIQTGTVIERILKAIGVRSHVCN